VLKMMYPYPSGTPFPPPVFDLVSPVRLAVGSGWSPVFSWTPAQYQNQSPFPLPSPNGSIVQADDYRLLVDDDPYFRSPAIDTILAGTSHAGGTLADGKVYFWTVQARNSGGITEPWCEPIGAFYMGAAMPTILYVDDDAPTGGDGSAWTTAFSD